MITPSETSELSPRDEPALVETDWFVNQDEVPQWHKDILEERQRAFEEGRIQALDWEEAKRQIEKAI